MGEVKHTGGPWRIDTNGDDLQIVGRPDHHCTRYGVEGEWDVATVERLHEDRKAEMIANASLIAAAPDLLEALKLCVENIQGIADEEDIPSTAIRDFARAVIAKATEGSK